MTLTKKFTLLIFNFLLFTVVACNQPSTTATTTPPKTPTETVATTQNSTQDATKQILGELSDKKADGLVTKDGASGNENVSISTDDQNDLQNGTVPKKRHHRHHRKTYDRSPTGVLPGEGTNDATATQNDNQTVAMPEGVVKQIPAKVYTVLAYVLKNHTAPANYVGGRVFTNVEKVLPVNDTKGRRINYQEWDVNPHVNGVNRGVERLCTGDDNRYWFTNDHYKTFTQVIPK